MTTQDVLAKKSDPGKESMKGGLQDKYLYGGN